MPRVHKRKPGSRSYKDYSEEVLIQALNDCKHDKVRDVAKRYNIPFRTLYNKIKGAHKKQCGRPTIFSFEEEEQIAEHLVICADYGMPLDKFDIRVMVSVYLQKIDRTVPQFKNNIPGPDWISSFIKRHEILTTRMCQNIKRSRAGVEPGDIDKYFERLAVSLQDIHPSNILNYDETNLADEPGLKKCIFRRGVKYPERIINHSKGNITVMFAGTADGEILPPYVIYKSQHLWNSWCDGGPKGTRYSRTRSGWMDSEHFEEWFNSIVLPWARRKDGQIVVIGDNLSSHLSPKVLDICAERNIRFVLLPPNSTDKCQPLDVSYFGPMKTHWRKIMEEYKMKEPTATSLDKAKFPSLLCKLMNRLGMHGRDNLVAGFRACGIYPLNKQLVLKKFPEFAASGEHDKENPHRAVSPAVLEYLKQFKYTPGQRRKSSNGARKRLNVEPGKSVSAEELMSSTSNSNTQPSSPVASTSSTGPEGLLHLQENDSELEALKECQPENDSDTSAEDSDASTCVSTEQDVDLDLLVSDSSDEEWQPPKKRSKE